MAYGRIGGEGGAASFQSIAGSQRKRRKRNSAKIIWRAKSLSKSRKSALHGCQQLAWRREASLAKLKRPQ